MSSLTWLARVFRVPHCRHIVLPMPIRFPLSAAFVSILACGSAAALAAPGEPVEPVGSGKGAAAMGAGPAAALYQCQGASGATVFRSTAREGCVMLDGPDPAGPDPLRWLPLVGASGMISYLDLASVRRHGTDIGVVLMRNVASGGIRTTSGEPIRSSLRRMVVNCSTSMYAWVEQTLYPTRYARGESLYTMPLAGARKPQPALRGSVANQVIARFCR